MVGSNTEGMEKVEDSNGNYAYFMESSGIAYLVERRCKLAQVGQGERFRPIGATVQASVGRAGGDVPT